LTVAGSGFYTWLLGWIETRIDRRGRKLLVLVGCFDVATSCAGVILDKAFYSNIHVQVATLTAAGAATKYKCRVNG
jgi:hypothetical protein